MHSRRHSRMSEVPVGCSPASSSSAAAGGACPCCAGGSPAVAPAAARCSCCSCCCAGAGCCATSGATCAAAAPGGAAASAPGTWRAARRLSVPAAPGCAKKELSSATNSKAAARKACGSDPTSRYTCKPREGGWGPGVRLQEERAARRVERSWLRSQQAAERTRCHACCEHRRPAVPARLPSPGSAG